MGAVEASEEDLSASYSLQGGIIQFRELMRLGSWTHEMV